MATKPTSELQKANQAKVFIPQAQKNKIAAGLSSATDVGITDINKLGAGNLEGIKQSTYKQQMAGELVTDAQGNKSASTIGRAPVAPTQPAQQPTAFQNQQQAQADLKAGKITQQQYDTIHQGYLANIKTVAGTRGPEAALAQQKLEEDKTAGGVPAPSKPGEGETYEQVLQRQLNDARNLASYYEQQNKTKGAEMATVSGQVADFGSKLAEFTQKNQDAIAGLNAKIAGLGDRTSQIAEGVIRDGVNPNITQDTQAKIAKVWQDGGTVDEMNAKVKQILIDSAAVTAPTVLGTKPTVAPTGPTGAIGAPPYGTNEAGLKRWADEDPASFDAWATANNWDSSFYQRELPDMASLIDTILSAGGDGVDFNSGDLALQQLKFSLGATSAVGAKLEKSYLDRKNRIQTQQDFYKDFWDSRRAQGESLLTSIKDSQLRRLDLQEQGILAQKEQKMSELAKKTERYESFVKAQMAAANIPIEGQMGATMLVSSMANWEDFVANQELAYDEKIAAIHDKSIDIVDNYATKLFEFSSNLDDKMLAKQDDLAKQFEENEKDLTANEVQIQMANISSINTYFKEKIDAQAALKKQAYEAQKEEEKRLWDVQVDGIKQLGGVVKIDENGKPTFATGPDGKMLLNTDAQKLFNEMNKGELKYDENTGEWFTWNPNTKTRTMLGSENPNTGLPYGGFQYQGSGAIQVGDKTFNIGDDWSKTGLPGSDAECVGYARFCSPTLPTGLFTLDDKLAIANAQDLQAGDVIFTNAGPGVATNADGTILRTGHAAYVTKVYEDGTFDVVEANYENDPNKAVIGARVGLHTSEIAVRKDGQPGIYRGPTKAVTMAGAQQNQQAYQDLSRKYNKKQKEDLLKVRTDFAARPEVKEFKVVDAAYRRILSVSNTPQAEGGASDLALIFSFMKILDPGSTVREGEFANAQNSAGVSEIIRAKYNQLRTGGRLSESQRKDFVNRAKGLYEAQKSQFQVVADEFSNLSQYFRLDPNDVIGIWTAPQAPAPVDYSSFGFQETDAQSNRYGSFGFNPLSTQ